MTNKEKEKKIAVVKELPVQSLREVESEDNIYECYTVEEALSEILDKIRELSKRL